MCSKESSSSPRSKNSRVTTRFDRAVEAVQANPEEAAAKEAAAEDLPASGAAAELAESALVDPLQSASAVAASVEETWPADDVGAIDDNPYGDFEQTSSGGHNKILKEVWYMRLDELKEYKSKNGHTNVSQKHGGSLGMWVNTQRTAYSKGKLSDERVQKLDALDFVWNIRDWKRSQKRLTNRSGKPLTKRSGKRSRSTGTNMAIACAARFPVLPQLVSAANALTTSSFVPEDYEDALLEALHRNIPFRDIHQRIDINGSAPEALMKPTNAAPSGSFG